MNNCAVIQWRHKVDPLKYKIVTDMCLTMRHDYGLLFDPMNPTSGMTEFDRQALYNQMSQLYDHHISPLVDTIRELQNDQSIS